MENNWLRVLKIFRSILGKGSLALLDLYRFLRNILQN